MPHPWVVAHRGASGHAPENTMVAFRRAVELGATFIETDLRFTRDAQFVAIHDATVERTTSGRGSVRELTLAELRQLDAGSWFGAEFAGERIPTLDEILNFAHAADVVFYLEVKTEVVWGVQHTLVSALRRTEQVARTVILSFDPSMLSALLGLEHTLMTGLLYDRLPADPIAQALQIGVRQIAPRRDLLSGELVQRAHAADLQVVTWTVDKLEEMRAAIATGVNGIITNYPDRLFGVLGNSPSG
jgi:glycerophosphoryl diester phosphodiesterase